MPNFKIGALATQTGTNPPTIRYYEDIGLLRRADRRPGGQRVYSEADINRLIFIRRCREFGFSIDQVRALVALVQDPSSSCMRARDLAQAHLTTVRAKLGELRALERSIAAFIAACDASCAGGSGPDCVVLQDLSRVPNTAACSQRDRSTTEEARAASKRAGRSRSLR